MRLINTYHKPGEQDPYTFVLDKTTPETGYYTLLAMSEFDRSFDHYTSGRYDTDGPNEHRGQRVAFHQLEARVVVCFYSRIAIPEHYGREA
jgi:hypothetical protein